MLGAVALLVAVVLLLSGGRLFGQRERAVAHFEGSVYGLQLGAPVVFRGVRLGSVVGIGVVYQGQPRQYAIPVLMEIERNAIVHAQGGAAAVSVAELVAQGLRARLATQSLLTGLLYVDLDLGEAGPAPAAAPAAASRAVADAPPEIPTVASPIQALQKQLQAVDLERLLGDISAMAAGARQLVANPKLLQSVEELAAASAEMRRLLVQLNQRLGPLAEGTQATLAAARQAAEQWGGAVGSVNRAADSVSGSMGRVERLAGRLDSELPPTLASVQRAADELGRTAAALRSASSGDSGLVLQLDRATQDLARASRAVRDLADLLQQQPEALIRGRAATP